MSTKTALDNAIAKKGQAFSVGDWQGVASWAATIRDLERRLRDEERAEIIEACRAASAALEALRNVLAKVSEQEGKQ